MAFGPRPFVSPRDLARALGVSESSLKRWADDGLVHVLRTAGGHRRIAVADAVRFARESGLRIEAPGALGLDAMVAKRASVAGRTTTEALFAAFLRDDWRVARGLIVGAFLAGDSIAEICDGPVREALAQAGELWQHGSDGIVVEHRAVDTCLQALSFIRALIPAAPDDAPVALGAAVEGDPYVLPSLSAALVLADAGFREVNLGPTMPAEALLSASARYAPLLVWRTASIPTGHETLRQDLSTVLRGLAPRVRVVLGGRGVPAGVFRMAERVPHLGSMAELTGFARALLATHASA
jgi:MerR family transcriptional regulator, light-induced transcriptional regulator